MFYRLSFLLLMLCTFNLNAASHGNHSSSQPISIPQDKKEKIAKKIDDGRLIAGYSYKTSKEKREKFINDNPRIRELIKYSTRISGITGSKTSPVRSECAFVAQALKSGIPDWGHFIVSIRGTKGMSRSDWSTNFSTKLNSADLRSIETSDHKKMEQKSQTDQENIEFEDQLLQEDSSPNSILDVDSAREIKTHSGFYRYASSMVDDIWREIYKRTVDKTAVYGDDQSPIIDALKKIRISIYGHSLGGAAAQIIALQLRQRILSQLVLVYEQNSSQMKETLLGKIKVYSYESPLVFDQAGSEFFNEKIGEKNHIRVVQRARMSSGIKAVSDLTLHARSIFDFAKQSLNSICSISQNITPSGSETSLSRQTSHQAIWIYDPLTLLPNKNIPTGVTCKVDVTSFSARECAEMILHKMMPVSHDKLNNKCFMDLIF